MKIILSPSKTQNNDIRISGLKHPKYDVQSKEIMRNLKLLSVEEIASVMKLKGRLLDESFNLIQHFKLNQKLLTPAIHLYTGVVYESLSVEEYSESELEYCNQNVRILSALYGVLAPQDGVQAYRLDFTMKLKNLNLNQIWKNKILDYFKHETLILDCASQEFSHFLKPFKEKVHRVEFIDRIDGQDKIISYNAKKLRGLMVDYCIRNNVQTIEEIKRFDCEGYVYDTEQSNHLISVFIKSKR